jgi:hypothetical protein
MAIRHFSIDIVEECLAATMCYSTYIAKKRLVTIRHFSAYIVEKCLAVIRHF